MALLLLPLLAQGVYAGVISTISTLTVGTAKLATSMCKNANPDVSNTVKKLDIEHRLRLIESIIKYSVDSHNKIPHAEKIDLEKTTFEIINADYNAIDPIEICLRSINSAINEIHLNLNDINKKIELHHQKWFNSWRTLNIKPKLDALEINCNILDKRFDELIKVHQLLHTQVAKRN